MSSTEFTSRKEQIIERISQNLIAKGYSKDRSRKEQFVDTLRNLLRAKTTWNPDIFLVHPRRPILIADVQLLEERQNQYIPVAMEQAVPNLGSDFGPIEVVLFIPIGGDLDPITIQKATALNVVVNAIDSTGVIHRILDAPTVCRTYKAKRNEQQVVKSQQTSRWVIPQVLVQKLNTLRNLEYLSQLQQFASDYFDASTPIHLSTQYKLASQCIENIFEFYDLDPCCRPLRISKDLQKIARRKGESRDHFLHQFQTFLMGALILDSYVGSTSSPLILCKRYPRLDLPWLIASIFHDFGFDLANLDSSLDIVIGELRYESRGNLHYSTLLNSFHDFKNSNGDLDDWNPDSYIVQNTNLTDILFRAAIEKSARKTGKRLRANHGVLSAHKIVNLLEQLVEQAPSLVPVFMSSALSVSMHDKKIWAELFANSILPIDASKFPLLHLLILCDTLAEAGRPKSVNTGQQDAILTGFDLKNNIVCGSIWFSEPQRAYTMNFWAHFVQEKCFTNTFLKLKCRSLL